MAARQYQERTHFSPTSAAPPFSVSSPPGLSLTTQSVTNNAFAHSANVIPGLAFGSPPVPGLSSYIANRQVPSASPDQYQPISFGINGSGSKPSTIPVTKSHVDPLSEGEFEEEFEDLYEPKGVAAPPITTTLQSSHLDNMVVDEGDSSWLGVTQVSTRAASVADEDWEPTIAQDSQNEHHTGPSQTGAAAMTASTSQVPTNQPVPDLAKTVAEAKKKAQEAILALWPLKVRYQDYIDEGFDEAVVQALFRELGLDTAASQHANRGSKATLPVGAKDIGAKQEQAQAPTTAAGAVTTAASSTPDDAKPEALSTTNKTKSAAEERKDKIARKLAAKSQKPVAIPIKSSAAVSGTAPTAPDKIKARKEVNALLQQKLAALKKAQEQAAANKLAAQTNLTPASTIFTQTAQTQSFSSTPNNHVDQEPLRDRQASEPIQDTHQNVVRPPLMTVASSSSGPSRLPKRPVASDFDSYTTPSYGSPKRSRTQDTLIIDVSDDDDVEMDIGSPVDDSFGSPGQPISDDQTAQHTSHEVQQQNSTPATPESNGKLHLLRGKIEEMRRRIAEAEAKKTSKTPIDTGSPRQQSPVHHPLSITASVSNRLPKVLELRQQEAQHRLSRNDRVVSVELLLVESDLKTKQDKLKEVVAEAARLEVEIKNALAQRQRLTTEMGSMEQDQGETPEAQPGAASQSAMTAQADLLTNSDDTDTVSEPTDQAQATSSSASPTFATEPRHVAADAEPLLDGAEEEMSASTKESSLIETSSEDEASPEEEDDDDDVSMSEDDSDHSDSDTSMKSTAAERVAEDSLAAPDAETPGDIHTPLATTSLDEPDEKLSEQGNKQSKALASLKISPDEDMDRVATNPTGRTGDILLTSAQTSPQQATIEEDVSSYRSPLEYFRAYRFHPRYSDEVAGGLKSLTYSSNINVEQMVCPTELEGENCVDPDCDYQHFQKMVLSDGDIITQIGSADMFNGSTKVQFIAGLRKILHDLKLNKVKDFDRITKAIIDYRAEFLADRSKVLALDGVTI